MTPTNPTPADLYRLADRQAEPADAEFLRNASGRWSYDLIVSAEKDMEIARLRAQLAALQAAERGRTE